MPQRVRSFLLSALVVYFAIPEISGRATEAERQQAPPSLLYLLRDGYTYVVRTPLVRGLVVGVVGGFTAGGAVIATAKLYASSLGGGDAAYSILFASVFAGLAAGMALGPVLARQVPHRRLFAAARSSGPGCRSSSWRGGVVHLFMAIAAVLVVGAFAGIAFLIGLTIIGTEVADGIRGRVNAFVQSLVRLVLLGAMSVVPVVVGVVATRTVTVGDTALLVDGTRFVLAGAGVLAAAVGVVARRQMTEEGSS
ncbi:hypothetical protein [Pseudonocardia sp. ICBG601]|uniref:hypothetical protein n=1 Tax=Pseudonocardia sp. ICBG601 TaxID=2846759 RepID=UPI001CF6E716|nr:hypothetical protein [Pseudonocardia sp. ICBG601]